VTCYAVTGATGFTGGKLAARLCADGHQVIALVRSSSDTSALEILGVTCVRLSLLNEHAVQTALIGVHTVFHIAAAYRTEHADEQEFFEVNVDATRVVLTAALKVGVARFVHCSTVGVQGAIDEPPATEDYRLAPGDHYQESKLQGERLALSFGDKGLAVSVVRPVGIYGPGDIRFLKLFRSISKRLFLMIGDGETLYHLTYIDDLIDGFLLAGRRQAAIGEIFTICGPQYSTLNQLTHLIATTLGTSLLGLTIPSTPVVWAAHVCDWVCKRLGVHSPLYPRRVDFFLLDRAFTHAKASELLGYQPQVKLADGLRRTYEWYRDQGFVK